MKDIVCMSPAVAANKAVPLAEYLYDEMLGQNGSFDHQYMMTGEMLGAFFEQVEAGVFESGTSLVSRTIGKAAFLRNVSYAISSKDIALVDVVDLTFAQLAQYKGVRVTSDGPGHASATSLPNRLVAPFRGLGLIDESGHFTATGLAIAINSGLVPRVCVSLLKRGEGHVLSWVSELAEGIVTRTLAQHAVYVSKTGAEDFLMVTADRTEDHPIRYRWRYGEYLPSPGARPFRHPVDDSFLNYTRKRVASSS